MTDYAVRIEDEMYPLRVDRVRDGCRCAHDTDCQRVLQRRRHVLGQVIFAACQRTALMRCPKEEQKDACLCEWIDVRSFARQPQRPGKYAGENADSENDAAPHVQRQRLAGSAAAIRQQISKYQCDQTSYKSYYLHERYRFAQCWANGSADFE